MNVNDLISILTVRIIETSSETVLGTGVIYYEKNLLDKVYILTASHCLFKDSDNFKDLITSVKIEIYNSIEKKYEPILVTKIDEKLLSKSIEKDIGIIILEKPAVEQIILQVPETKVIGEEALFHDFIIKGFPNATYGKELDVIYPEWKQKMTETQRFQLQLNEDYSDWATSGFSGGGVYINSEDEIFLYGIFTRYRSEERGRVIYCQYIITINSILNNNFLPTISISYFGQHSLNQKFFEKHITKSIKNLGPRFNEVLNLKLPISKLFNDIARDNEFRLKFEKIVDTWLINKGYREEKDNDSLKKIEKEFLSLKEKLKSWMTKIDYSLELKIELDWFISKLEELNISIKAKKNEIYELLFKENSKKKQYENELSRLREVEDINYKFLRSIKTKLKFSLVNNPILILKGEAGSGKSHLLGDIATVRLKSNQPSFLLLGQNFKSSNTIERNIIEQLGVNCSFKDLLESVNSIGKQIGSRFLFLIDAINEGAGADLWHGEIAGFINEISEYKNVGLVLSVRTTYFESLIPINIIEDKNITKIEHEGFKGNEYAALKLFCENYGLKQPNFPILSPEFSNPLFLVLICEGVRNSEDKTFPQGFQGVTKIFEYYIEAIYSRLVKLREVYKLRKDIIRNAIDYFAKKEFEKEYRRLKLDEAIDLFDKKFERYPNLLNDLIQEGVFIRNIQIDFKSNENFEVVYFAFERFGDFCIASGILSQYSTKEEVIEAFKRGKQIGKLVEDGIWPNNGVFEAISVLLSESFQLELYEVLLWKIEEEKKIDSFSHEGHVINNIFLEGLKWRKNEDIDNEKISKWIKSEYFDIEIDEWLLILGKFSSIKGHPLNSDRLYKNLIQCNMPERDSFLQSHFKWYAGYNDNNEGMPRRLIDWAWLPSISCNIDKETARLTGQTLAWVLSSTNRALRDQTTKTMVNLLVEQPQALIEILRKFRSIDDIYILERLYAIAYGCILRTNNMKSISLIAKYTYDNIFKKSEPPKHILLRDYARSIIEFAIHKKSRVKVDKKLITPPYNSKLPTFPDKDTISHYNLKEGNDKVEGKMVHVYNRIHFSVISWDFSRYVIDPALSHFSPISFVKERKYKAFIRKLSKIQQELINDILEINELIDSFKSDASIEKAYKNDIDKLEAYLKDSYLSIDKFFNKEKSSYIRDCIIPFYRSVNHFKNAKYHRDLFEREPIKNWIVMRAHEIGYDVNLHGNFDNNISDSYSRYENKVERIGKKYQWIAFFEIMSILTDNYKISDYWSHSKKYFIYNGPWQLNLRDIDPGYITRDAEEIDEEEELQSSLHVNEEWWSDIKYDYWNQPDSEWYQNISDLPKAVNVILKKDNQGNEWLHLKKYAKWYQPKPLGEERYQGRRKEIFYEIHGYIVRRKDKKKLVKFLSDKNFWGDWMPKPFETYREVLNREKFWASSCKDLPEEEIWEEIFYNNKGTNLKVLTTITDSKGSISEDKSGANNSYSMPCKLIYNALKLNYSATDGDFNNKDGDIIVTNISNKGLMIRKDKLLGFLHSNELDIIWTVMGEKMIYQTGSDENYFGLPCGICYFDEDKFVGEMKMFKRN